MEATIFQASVYIKHPGHFPIMREELCRAQQSSEHTDLWLVAKDRVMIPVHRFLLPSVASLTQDVWCCEQPTVVLAQETSQTLVSLVTLLYNGTCSLQGTSILEVIEALGTLGIFLPLARLQLVGERELMVGAEYYPRGREQEETYILKLASKGQEDALLVPVSKQEEHNMKELLVHGEVNTKQQEVQNPKLSEDQFEEHGDEDYLEEIITRVVEYQKRKGSVPRSSEIYHGGKHKRPSIYHLPGINVRVLLEPEQNIEDCLVSACSEDCELVEGERQVWLRQRVGQLEKQNLQSQAEQAQVRQPKVMLCQLDYSMINSSRIHMGGTFEPTRKISRNLSSDTRMSLLQVAVKQPVHLGAMEGEGTAAAYSYTPLFRGQTSSSLSHRDVPDNDERSNGVKSDLGMSHICPRLKEECLKKTKRINHIDSSFAASAVQYEELVQWK